MAEEERWAPFRMRLRGESQAWHGLQEGVPGHLAPTLRQTIFRRFDREPATVAFVQRRLRIEPVGQETLLSAVARRIEQDPEVLLDLADALLVEARGAWLAAKDDLWNGERLREDLLEFLREMSVAFHQADSAYEVDAEDNKPWRLKRRVDGTATAAVQDLVGQQVPPSDLIAAAWSAVFRRESDLDGAFRSAVLAVESAAAAVLIPNDPEPSLGKAIAHLRDTQARWTVAGLDDKAQPSAATLLGMLETVWQNHQRHVGQGGSPPEPAGQGETEAVVFLAVTLVQWFVRRYVQRRR